MKTIKFKTHSGSVYTVDLTNNKAYCQPSPMSSARSEYDLVHCDVIEIGRSVGMTYMVGENLHEIMTSTVVEVLSCYCHPDISGLTFGDQIEVDMNGVN